MRRLSGRPRRVAAGVAGAAVAAALAVEPVAAHPAWESYVELRWGGPFTYTYEASFPAGEWRDRFREGVLAWPRAIGVPEVAFAASSGADWSWRDPCGNQLHGVHAEAIDGAGGTVAETRWCFDGDDRIISTEIRFDSAETWHTGDGGVPAGSTDLESVVAHEAGHGWGWSGPHLSGSECPTGAGRHTMCATIPRGTADQRTPEEHDLHIVDPAYADPAPK